MDTRDPTCSQILKFEIQPCPTIDKRRLIWLGDKVVQRLEFEPGKVVWTLDDQPVASPKTEEEFMALMRKAGL